MTVKIFFHRVHRKLIKFVSPVLSWLFSKTFKTDSHKIVFDNFTGMGFGNNPKYIALEILRQNLPVKLVWLVESPQKETFPGGVTPVSLYSIRGIYERCTAKVWIDNVRSLYSISKKCDQIYLQVWHGPAGLKLTEKAAMESLSPRYIAQAKHDGSICDAILSNSVAESNIFRRDFWLAPKTEILEYGLPVNDYIINNRGNQAATRKLRRQNQLADDDYIIVYAPTFRDDGSLAAYNLDFSKIIEAYERKTRKNCTLIVKLHPNLRDANLSFSYQERLINAAELPNCKDFQTLSLLADCVISDYSTTIFDFLIQTKPAFVYAPDLEEYIKTRGLIAERFYKLPCKINTTCQELINAIQAFDAGQFTEDVHNYYDTFPDFDDGNASMRIVDWIKAHVFES